LQRLFWSIRTIFAGPASLVAGLLSIICLVNLFYSATRFVVPAKLGNDDVSRYDRILREVRETLRPEDPSLVGYITDHPLSEWSPDDVGVFYETQYGLAPIVVRQEPGKERFIVARLRKTPMDDPRLAGLTVVRDFGGGVLLFRQRSS
jgi:hypothetical protein